MVVAPVAPVGALSEQAPLSLSSFRPDPRIGDWKHPGRHKEWSSRYSVARVWLHCPEIEPFPLRFVVPVAL